jgi:prophage regulatory protein
MTNLFRRPKVLEIQGIGKTNLQNRINEGLFPEPISIGGRAVAWPSYEVESITNALIAGKSPSEIRQLVAYMMEKRNELGGEI